jgi:hypothetical protein
MDMKCLRCGKELSGTGAFCEACSVTVAEPLTPSPYLNTKISIPKRKPAAKPKKPEGKKSSGRDLSRPRVAVCLVTILLCAFLLLQLYYSYGRYTKAEAEVARLRSVEDECVHLTDLLRQAEGRIVALEEALAREAAP